MLKRVIGCSGSGKTEYIFTMLGEALEQGKTCYVLVPEQQAVTYEGALCDRFGDKANLLCEVLNFERLPNRIAREYGGLCVNNIDKGGSCALLSLVAEELKDELDEYSLVASDTDFAASLLTLFSKMKMALVTPEVLETAIRDSDSDFEPKLKIKLSDILKIYKEYEKTVGTDLTDSHDALTRLIKELPEKPFFKNSCVFIDNYYTFTEQEYELIAQMILQSDDTYISFTVDSTRAFFEENAKSAERIKRMSAKPVSDHFVGEYRRSASKALKYLEENIWENSVKPFEGDDNAIRLLTAKNRFDEVEAVASEILSFVRNGGRFKDITVLTGNTEKYSSIVDSVFSRAEIPCYMSAKEDISVTPLFSYLLASLDVINEDFSLRSMKRYIKSGFSGLTVAESDAVLNYASSWKLRGKAWYGENDWILNPEGYREDGLSARAEKQLALANAARQKLLPTISALRDTLSQKKLTVSSCVRALYNHLITTEADEKLRKTAEILLQKGEREQSDRMLSLWNVLINIFDQLDSLCGSREVTPKRLSALIKLMCDCYSLGAIPASCDSVTFGDASLVRANNSKLVIVLGACDGEFPSSTVNSSFFNRKEATALEELGLNLADRMEKQLNTNRFFVYAALSSPTERLVVTCPKSEITGAELRPSSAWNALTQMFPDVSVHKFSVDEELYSRDLIASNFPSFEEGSLKTAIELALNEKKLPFFDEHPLLIDRKSEIDFDSDSLLLSPSRFERYILCPFSFFGSYLLDLKEKKQNDFASSEIGTFVHKILELFLRDCVSTGEFKRPTEDERRNKVDDLTKKYFLDVLGNGLERDKRFMYTYQNVVKTVDFVSSALCDEFSESKFTPSGFEFKLGLKDADVPAIEYDVDGKRVLLRGSIDRVDTYVRDGITYVRVADYKTYSKKFSASLVAQGIDTQLLHYLFGYCEKMNAKPAAMMYYSISLPNVHISGNETPEEIKDLLVKSVGRSGVFLNDEDVVFAMSPSGKFVPLKRNKSGELSKSGSLLSSEEFEELGNTLKKKVQSISTSIFNGNMDVSPDEELMKDQNHHPCTYCALGDMCRSKSRKENDDESDDSAE